MIENQEIIGHATTATETPHGGEYAELLRIHAKGEEGKAGTLAALLEDVAMSRARSAFAVDLGMLAFGLRRERAGETGEAIANALGEIDPLTLTLGQVAVLAEAAGMDVSLLFRPYHRTPAPM